MRRKPRKNKRQTSIKPKRKEPGYRLHKHSGRGFIELDGKRHYTGRYGEPAAEAAALRLKAQWIANGKCIEAREVEEVKATSAAVADDLITVEEVAARFWKAAEKRYVDGEGNPTAEHGHHRAALSIVRQLYGPTPAADFGPNALRLVRESMIEKGWSRPYVNAEASRIKRVWKWAVSHELIPPTAVAALDALTGLRYGEAKREGRIVRAVPLAFIHEIEPHVSQQVWGLVQFQLATGCRPGEAVQLRLADVNMSGEVWEYRPRQHKGAHRGVERIIYVGPRGQSIIEGFMPRQPSAHLFSPAEAEQERRDRLSAQRKTPLSCGNHVGSNRVEQPSRRPGTAYTVASYRQAVEYGIAAANRVRAKQAAEAGKDDYEKIPHWTPHVLRHVAATELRRQFGIEAAKTVLGHSSMSATVIYAEADAGKAKSIIGKVG